MPHTVPTPAAGERLAADLEAAVAQYHHGATPTAHLKLILQRYHERLPEPREVPAYEATAPTDRRELTALRRLADDVHAILTAPPEIRNHVALSRLKAAHQRYGAYRLGLDRPAEPAGAGSAAECTTRPTYVVEAYSAAEGRVHGSLDECRYACAAHLRDVEREIAAAGMSAYRCVGQVPEQKRRCGDVFDYTALSLKRGGRP